MNFDTENDKRQLEMESAKPVEVICNYCGYLKPDHEERCIHGLKNAIGMQLQFYTHSGASIEDTVDRIYKRCMGYLKAKNAQLSEQEAE